jgi:hypothetical protein
MTFYITLLSDASRDLHPNNTIAFFRDRLPRPVELLQGAWEVGVCQLSYSTPESETELQPIFMCCDVMGPQVVGDTLARYLSTVHYPSPDGHHIFDKVYYVPVENTDVQTVALEVLTKLGEQVPFPDSMKPLDAVLHFRRRV